MLTWEFSQYTSTCDLDAPLGFNAPAALGQEMTAQLHQKDGDAIANVAQLQAAVNFNPTNPVSNGVSTQLLPAVTDKCWRLLPTNSGNMLYAKARGHFAAQLTNATAAGGAPGNGYVPAQGARAFYSHMLTPEPNMATAACHLNRCCAKSGDAAAHFEPLGSIANLNRNDLCSGYSATVNGLAPVVGGSATLDWRCASWSSRVSPPTFNPSDTATATLRSRRGHPQAMRVDGLRAGNPIPMLLRGRGYQ